MEQFTASEVRDYLFSIEERSSRQWLIAHDAELGMLRQFADLLEAQEKAVPVAYAEFADNGCVRMWSRGYEERSPGTRMVPLYTHPAPQPQATEKLEEALRDCIRDLFIAAEYGKTMRNPNALLETANRAEKALAVHSAQAQPPAARVPDSGEMPITEDLDAYELGYARGWNNNRKRWLAAQENPNG